MQIVEFLVIYVMAAGIMAHLVGKSLSSGHAEDDDVLELMRTERDEIVAVRASLESA